jgi:hypothetical protein
MKILVVTICEKAGYISVDMGFFWTQVHTNVAQASLELTVLLS